MDELYVEVTSPSMDSDLDSQQIDTEQQSPDVSADEEQQEILIELSEQTIECSIEGIGISIIPTDHSQLTNLDYEHSGHTGFASKPMVDEIYLQVINETLSLHKYNN